MQRTRSSMFNDKYAQMMLQFEDMIRKYTFMWGGYFRVISMAKQYINLNPRDAIPVHATLYHREQIKQLLKRSLHTLHDWCTSWPQLSWCLSMRLSLKKMKSSVSGFFTVIIMQQTLGKNPVLNISKWKEFAEETHLCSRLVARHGILKIEMKVKDAMKRALVTHLGPHPYKKMQYRPENHPTSITECRKTYLRFCQMKCPIFFWIDSMIIFPVCCKSLLNTSQKICNYWIQLAWRRI